MRKVPKEYENKDYVNYIDTNLYLLITLPHKQKNIQLIRNKLKGDTLEIFNKTLSYRCLIELAHTINKSIPYSFFDVENLNKKRSLDESQKEAEGLLNLYLDSIDKNKFLESISEITYWMAKIELKEQIEIYKKYLQSWAEWHSYLEKKNRNKREGEKIKEKLRVILGDKIDDLEKIKEEYQKNIERLKAGKENLFVNIDHEIDVSRSEPNDVFILPDVWLGENKDFRVIEENTNCVLLDNKKYSLWEYYEAVKDKINNDWIKSKDILKQVITIYMIKRCQNGDNEAFNILYNLYEESVKKLELNFTNHYKNINEDDIKGKGIRILVNLLKGDTPSLTYEYLNKNRFEKQHIDLLNKKPYIALNEAYESMFFVINGQFNVLNEKLHFLEKNTKDYRSRLKRVKIKTKKKYLENIWKTSQHTLVSTNSFSTTFMLFDPIIFLGISPKYNKYLFKSAPNRNLTTWLLGDNTGNFVGMIWQELHNSLENKNPDEELSPDLDEYEEDKDNSDYFHKKVRKTEEN